MPTTLLEITAKYGVLIREWGDLYYALLDVSIDYLPVEIGSHSRRLLVACYGQRYQIWQIRLKF